MRGKIARRCDEDQPRIGLTRGGQILLHGRFEILDHVEAGILAQQGMAQHCDKIRSGMAGGEVARRQLRRFLHLLLAVKGIEERAPKIRLCNTGWIVFARQARRRHVEVAVEIDCECTVDCGTQAVGFDLRIGAAIGGPLQQAEGGVGVAEGVVRAVPIRMLVAGGEMRDAQCGGKGDRARDVGRRGATPERIQQGLQDRSRIFAQNGAPERGVIVPVTARGPASRKRAGQLMERRFGQDDEIDGVPPAIRLFATDRLGEDGH